MGEEFEMEIMAIQPSQLYISKTKLENLADMFADKGIEGYEPVPVKELNGRIIFTDGHTRAFKLYQMGLKKIRCFWDQDELDWQAYQVCVDWCIEKGIRDISHLEQRILDDEDYEKLWHERCRRMQAELAIKKQR